MIAVAAICAAAAAPGLAVAIAGLLVPAWAALVAGALCGSAIALFAAAASAWAGKSGSPVAGVGFRLAAVLVRIAGTALVMAMLSRTGDHRAAVAALLAAVTAGWLVEMAAWTIRLAQERKPARA